MGSFIQRCCHPSKHLWSTSLLETILASIVLSFQSPLWWFFWFPIYSALIKCLSFPGTKLVGVKDKINQTLTLSSKKFLFAYGDKIWTTNEMQGEVIMFPQGWI